MNKAKTKQDPTQRYWQIFLGSFILSVPGVLLWLYSFATGHGGDAYGGGLGSYLTGPLVMLIWLFVAFAFLYGVLYLTHKKGSEGKPFVASVVVAYFLLWVQLLV